MPISSAQQSGCMYFLSWPQETVVGQGTVGPAVWGIKQDDPENLHALLPALNRVSGIISAQAVGRSSSNFSFTWLSSL